MKEFFLERKFSFLDVIVFAVITCVASIVTNKVTGACHNADHKHLEASQYLQTSVIKADKPFCETTEYKKLTTEEKIRALEKKVFEDKVCYPVYTPTPDEVELMNLKQAQLAIETISVVTNCDPFAVDGPNVAWTNVPPDSL